MLKKLSLATLIAISSISVANATSLSNIIKDVDLSGMIRVRFYNDSNKTDSNNRWRTSADFKFTVPVNEELKVVYKLGSTVVVFPGVSLLPSL